jgi:hypothetical protein
VQAAKSGKTLENKIFPQGFLQLLTARAFHNDINVTGLKPQVALGAKHQVAKGTAYKVSSPVGAVHCPADLYQDLLNGGSNTKILPAACKYQHLSQALLKKIHQLEFCVLSHVRSPLG